MEDGDAMPEKRRTRLCMWLPDNLHARLRKVADLERRTMADTGIIAVERYLDAVEAELAERKK